uniref:Uncharacterized protein n=1 Tax=Arundo donax TaxID=35708 RepID=A0A0A8Z3M5_ARUDO
MRSGPRAEGIRFGFSNSSRPSVE